MLHLARLCEAAGAGCLSENVFETADCDAFEENGWDGAHIVAGLNVTRPALIADGYTDQAGDAFKVLPVCAEATRKCFRTWHLKKRKTVTVQISYVEGLLVTIGNYVAKF